jgi:hypothetical protein
MFAAQGLEMPRVALQAQREQIAIDAAKVTLQTQGRLEQHASKRLINAQAALEKCNALGINALTDKDCGEMIRWVLPEAKVTARMRDLKKRMLSSQNWPLLTTTGSRIYQLEHTFK